MLVTATDQRFVDPKTMDLVGMAKAEYVAFLWVMLMRGQLCGFNKTNAYALGSTS